jgi:hypothetical protein
MFSALPERIKNKEREGLMSFDRLEVLGIASVIGALVLVGYALSLL